MNHKDGRGEPAVDAPEHGVITQELGRRFNQAPASQAQRPVEEQRARTRGGWMIVCGLFGVGLTMLAVWFYDQGHTTEIPLAYLLPIYAFCFGAILLGCLERTGRAYRANIHQTLDEIIRVEHGLRLLVHLLPDELKQQWYAGYGRGVEDGQRLRTGTDHHSLYQTSGDVLKMRPRNRPRG